MAEEPGRDSRRDEDDYRRTIGAKGRRKIKARRRGDEGVWFGLGMFGLVGWSVAIPTVLGIAAGLWIDRTWPSRYSWTLMLLVGGMILGCVNTWYWLNRERQDIEQSKQEHDDEHE